MNWRGKLVQMESFVAIHSTKYSASFAVESFQSLYLKTNFPKEFMAAVINNFGGYYSRELYFSETVKTGAQIHAPCVNQRVLHSIRGNDVYTCFVHEITPAGIGGEIIVERSSWPLSQFAVSLNERR
jgi:DNA polymerase-3 subunit alpha